MGRGRRPQGKAAPRHPVRIASQSERDSQPAGAACEVCGGNQEHYLEVHLGREKHIFDSFECAIRGLMPQCSHCGCLLLGPGVQVGDRLFCSMSCASLSGAVEVYLFTTETHR